jgi:hypothetical protein
MTKEACGGAVFFVGVVTHGEVAEIYDRHKKYKVLKKDDKICN